MRAIGLFICAIGVWTDAVRTSAAFIDGGPSAQITATMAVVRWMQRRAFMPVVG